jgi:uncharacterized protein YraI
MISPKTTVSAAALLLASAGAAAAFPATAVTDLNVRSGPGTGYGVVGVLQDGENVEVVARSGGWYQLADGGWASGNYLDAEGGGTAYIDQGYGYGDYGPVAFYYDDSPYYWDNAGFYFYIRDGRRHRIDRDWWRDHRHNVRWDKSWHNRDWGPNRDANRGDHDRRMGRGDRNDDGDRRGRGGDWNDNDRSARGEDRGGDESNMRSGRSSVGAGVDSGAGAEVGRGTEIRGGGDVRAGGNRGGSNRGSDSGGQRRLEGNIPGGGY